MPSKPTGVGLAEKTALSLAGELGYELVDVELTKEPAGKFLRFYIDKNGGVSLDDCEAFHRRIIKLVEDLDYDYLEVSSPGADRPLKKDADFTRAAGQQVEIRLYKPIDGQKVYTGMLVGRQDGRVMIETNEGAALSFDARQVALVKLAFDFDESMLGVLDEEE